MRISITISHAGHVMTVTDTQPLVLGGDSRRWRRQAAEHLTTQFAQLAGILAIRFGKEGFRGAALDGRADG